MSDVKTTGTLYLMGAPVYDGNITKYYEVIANILTKFGAKPNVKTSVDDNQKVNKLLNDIREQVGDNLVECTGGNHPNVARTIIQMLSKAIDVKLIGGYGNDDLGQQIHQVLVTELGVDVTLPLDKRIKTRAAIVMPGEDPTTKTTVSSKTNLNRFIEAKHIPQFPPCDDPETPTLKDGDVLVINGSAHRHMTPEAAKKLLEVAKECNTRREANKLEGNNKLGVKVVLNPLTRPAVTILHLGYYKELLKIADTVVVNETEILAITNPEAFKIEDNKIVKKPNGEELQTLLDQDIGQMVSQLREDQLVVITHGDKGMHFIIQGHYHHQPAGEIEDGTPIFPNGCGDSVNAMVIAFMITDILDLSFQGINRLAQACSSIALATLVNITTETPDALGEWTKVLTAHGKEPQPEKVRCSSVETPRPGISCPQCN